MTTDMKRTLARWTQSIGLLALQGGQFEQRRHHSGHDLVLRRQHRERDAVVHQRGRDLDRALIGGSDSGSGPADPGQSLDVREIVRVAHAQVIGGLPGKLDDPGRQ